MIKNYYSLILHEIAYVKVVWKGEMQLIYSKKVLLIFTLYFLYMLFSVNIHILLSINLIESYLFNVFSGQPNHES